MADKCRLDFTDGVVLRMNVLDDATGVPVAATPSVEIDLEATDLVAATNQTLVFRRFRSGSTDCVLLMTEPENA